MSSRHSFLLQTTAAGLLAATNVPSANATRNAPVASGQIKKYRVPKTELAMSRLGYGCMSLASWDSRPLDEGVVANADRAINTAYDRGINLFDLADNYGLSKAEVAFGKVLGRSRIPRDKIVVQSKCGIRHTDQSFYFDCSYQRIVDAIDGSLRRLGMDYRSA